jgi:hypothetical protein
VVLKINSNSDFQRDMDLKNLKPHKHLNKERGKKYLFKHPFIEAGRYVARYEQNLKSVLVQLSVQLAPTLVARDRVQCARL